MCKLLRAILSLSLLVVLSPSAFGQLFNLNAPKIDGQRPTPLTTEKNTAITIDFDNLRVEDPDIFVPAYPQGFTLNVFPGDNYTLLNATVTPAAGFVGTLTVPVQVNDGKFNSNKFDLQIDVINFKPVITDQETITIKEEGSLTLLLTHLKVTDKDNNYPDDFTLTVVDGENYSINGNTIKSDPGFSGKLIVSVSVNDGLDNSNTFDLTINVKPNIEPVIKGQVPLSTNQGQKINILLENLTVEDSDNAYPDDFTLQVFSGTNYTFNGNEITPTSTYTGKLTVPVTVHDGIDESQKHNVTIEVRANKPPEITGQDALIINEDQSITITLNDLNVTDPDNVYPSGFSLKIQQGSVSNGNATVSETKITPSQNFNGTLTVPVRVSDGLTDSPSFPLAITVTPLNDQPVITGQDPNPYSIISENETQLQSSILKVSDPETQNTSSFAVKILSSSPNYIVSGGKITTKPGFLGALTISVAVNDGVVDSAPFNLKLNVIARSAKPLIIGQQPLVVNEDEPLLLKLGDLSVADEGNNYPKGFTMRISDGPDYTYEGLTVTPAKNFNGLLAVSVFVNDGENESENAFPLKIYVIPINDAPEIIAFEETPILYEPGSNPIHITELFKGEDIDNPYLSFAEVAFVDTTFDRFHDELIFENMEQIRGIYDPSKGILSLIGYAPWDIYDSAIRSIKYNYILTIDENGNQTEILPEPKAINFTLSDGALMSDTVTRVIKIETSTLLDIPNTFTPNGDTANDTWRIQSLANLNQFDKAIIKVYNKRGLLIFESKGLDKGWDGYFKGEVLPVDTYYYVIDLNLTYTKKTYKGAVMILR